MSSKINELELGSVYTETRAKEDHERLQMLLNQKDHLLSELQA